MKLSEVKTVLHTAIPKTETWNRAEGETYGLHNAKGDIEVTRALYCVTNSHQIINYAKKRGYDIIIEHHPFKIKSSVPTFVYHTALDCCDGGLNNIWADHMGIENVHFDDNLGAVGELENEETFESILSRVEELVGDKVIGQLKNSGNPIKKIVICAGLGGIVITEAEDTMSDLYITGELTGDAKYSKMSNVIEIGHTLSERCGINLFKDLLPDVEIDLAPLSMDKFSNEIYKSRMR